MVKKLHLIAIVTFIVSQSHGSPAGMFNVGRKDCHKEPHESPVKAMVHDIHFIGEGGPDFRELRLGDYLEVGMYMIGPHFAATGVIFGKDCDLTLTTAHTKFKDGTVREGTHAFKPDGIASAYGAMTFSEELHLGSSRVDAQNFVDVEKDFVLQRLAMGYRVLGDPEICEGARFASNEIIQKLPQNGQNFKVNVISYQVDANGEPIKTHQECNAIRGYSTDGNKAIFTNNMVLHYDCDFSNGGGPSGGVITIEVDVNGRFEELIIGLHTGQSAHEDIDGENGHEWRPLRPQEPGDPKMNTSRGLLLSTELMRVIKNVADESIFK